MTADLLRALDALVPVPDARGDWDDVLRRARVERRPVPVASVVRRPRRGLVVALAATAVLVALVATPAFGVQRLLLDLIGRRDVTFSKAPPAPNRIKKRFSDLGVGAPPRYQIRALAAQTRLAGTLRVGGKRNRLWVVPTAAGGYCYELEGYGGGCSTRPPRAQALGARAVDVGWSGRQRLGHAFELLGGGGTVNSPRVKRLELREGTHSTPLAFIWVSKPIGVGFFEFSLRAGANRVSVVAYDATGRVVARRMPPKARPLRVVPPGVHFRPRPRRFPATPPVPPSSPIQRGRGGGVSVIAGANGSVLFRADAVPAEAMRLLRHGQVAYGCFRLTREFGIFDTRGYGVSGAFARSVGLRLFGVGRPLDGCEISGSGGHPWPDRLGSHAPVEVPLTPAGRRFFTDRAAARDLAAFVRTPRVQRIRKERGAELVRDLRFYADLLARRDIHYRPTQAGVVFWKTSSTGRTFRVVVEHRRIVRQNLSPYAFVF